MMPDEFLNLIELTGTHKGPGIGMLQSLDEAPSGNTTCCLD